MKVPWISITAYLASRGKYDSTEDGIEVELIQALAKDRFKIRVDFGALELSAFDRISCPYCGRRGK